MIILLVSALRILSKTRADHPIKRLRVQWVDATPPDLIPEGGGLAQYFFTRAMRTLLAHNADMDDLGKHFFIWLAAAPAFVQVVLGVGFNLIIAPATLTAVAAGVTALERAFERFTAGEMGAAALRGDIPAWNTLRTFVRSLPINIDRCAQSFVLKRSSKQPLLIKSSKG